MHYMTTPRNARLTAREQHTHLLYLLTLSSPVLMHIIELRRKQERGGLEGKGVGTGITKTEETKRST